ncbi:hypothetical protein ABIF99_004963 [Bradyrhizobium japonicum]
MAMHGVPEPRDWRARLVWKHHRLFDPPAGDPELATGLPDCGSGWEKIIDRTCSDLGAPFLFGFHISGEIKVTQVYQELGTLRFRWEEVQNKGSRTWKPLCSFQQGNNSQHSPTCICRIGLHLRILRGPWSAPQQ